MKKRKGILISMIYVLFITNITIGQQLTIVNAQFMPYNITPEAMIAVGIVNNGGETNVKLESRLYNLGNQLLLTVRSAPFILKSGMNGPFTADREVSNSEYGQGSQPDYIKTTHNLPGGTFRICVSVIFTQTSEPADEFCDEIDSDFNQYLYLINPFDKDTIDSPLPLLTWNHSEPFDLLAEGEFFRMVVSEIENNQTAEEAIVINSPVMVRNYLTMHSLQYPFDARELLPGKKYAWQVQKMSNNIVTNKTETWEFFLRKPPEEKNKKYVVLQPTLSTDAYIAYNGKIYFKYLEEYAPKGDLKAVIISDNGKVFPVNLDKDVAGDEKASSVKSAGDNRFELDLDTQNIKPGYYRMVVKNEKRQSFYLKFYLPE